MAVKDQSYPLLAAQTEVWLKQNVNPETPIYNIGRYINIRGEINPALFEAALRQALAEAEALCVRIIKGVDGPRQVLTGFQKWSLPFIDLSAEPKPQGAAEEWMKADLARPVDLTHGPLFNFVLIQDRFRTVSLVRAVSSHCE